MSKLVADAAGTFGTRILTMGLGLITGIITARWLGPENRGIFSLVVLFPSTLVALTKFGQSQATVYFIRREEAPVSDIASNVTVFSLVLGAFLVLMTFFGREWLVDSLLKGVPVWSLMLVLPLIPILLIESYLYGVFQATDRFKAYNTRLIADNILTIGFVFAAIVVLDAGLPGALVAVMSVRLIMVMWVVYTVNEGTPIRLRFDVALFRRMLRYGLKSHIQIIASHFHVRAAMYLIAYFLNPAQVAFYSIGARLAERIMHVPQSLGLALFPRLAGSDENTAFTMTATACRQTLVVTVAMALVLTMVGPWAINFFYGEAYAEAAVPLPYVSWGIVMMSMYVLLSRFFTSRDRQVVNIVAAYIALGGNVTLNFLLIPEYGILGSAMATAVSYSTSALILFGAFLRVSGLPWHQVLIPKKRDVELWQGMAMKAVDSVRGRMG